MIFKRLLYFTGSIVNLYFILYINNEETPMLKLFIPELFVERVHNEKYVKLNKKSTNTKKHVKRSDDVIVFRFQFSDHHDKFENDAEKFKEG